MPIKKTYAIDELPNIPKGSGGLYSILPYERLHDGKALFKIGLATTFKHRFEQYHTYYPQGFYFQNILASPTKESTPYYYKDATDRNKRKLNKRTYYQKVEKYIQEDLKKHGAKQLYSTTRVAKAKQENDVLKGQTEWFYTSPKTITDTFKHAYKIYGGNQYSNDLSDINEQADKLPKASRSSPVYDAQIHYKIYS